MTATCRTKYTTHKQADHRAPVSSHCVERLVGRHEGEAVLNAYLKLLRLQTEALVAENWPRVEAIAQELPKSRGLTSEKLIATWTDLQHQRRS